MTAAELEEALLASKEAFFFRLISGELKKVLKLIEDRFCLRRSLCLSSTN